MHITYYWIIGNKFDGWAVTDGIWVSRAYDNYDDACARLHSALWGE